ncbi:dipeptidyl aminopeptidase/acylaminoacyl peptidase [Chitinophaga skermanii]|uniref:Dipeptidyl aminopeptidase/acylaminoacyl peptidase n=1 Tax=Chitinophaga skermanii TaxID=331697 RepID=A0A327QEP7_9BACT|nr:prolyl oligopeptidase family serine peptidase [Chitinophaga skermanii]RAJ02475.1 dipeptidyl aminopeptidase/acylaminoacyl peptidase [Chitinophaga skermanii]
MKFSKILLTLTALWPASAAFAQLAPLSVEKIMRDQKWVGTSPDEVFWSLDSKTLYFNWNPTKQLSDSMYFVSLGQLTPRKTQAADRAGIYVNNNVNYNNNKSAYTFVEKGDIFFLDVKTGKKKRVTQTQAYENSPQFGFNEQKIVYRSGSDFFAWDIISGETIQLTNFSEESKPQGGGAAPVTAQEKWLKNQQQQLFEVLRAEKEKKDAATAYNNSLPKEKGLRTLYLEGKQLSRAGISPDGRFITYTLVKNPKPAGTIVPAFVTETGYTTDIRAGAKVGNPQATYETYIFDRVADTVISIQTNQIPGISDLPDYVKDYPEDSTKPKPRAVVINGPIYSTNGTHAIVDIRSQDNKDRWIMLLQLATGKLELLNRQRDEAWIAGPGIGWRFGGGAIGWIDDHTCWYQSEQSGYSHLYTYNVANRSETALTSGKYEVQTAQLSNDKKSFYITTNEVHPGEKQFYRLNIATKQATRITTMEGANEVTLSPDEKWIAFRYSYSTKPWELYLQENKPGAKATQITHLAQSEEFKSYKWYDPKVITFQAKDGQTVYARLYTPGAGKKNGAAVIFVHGAGYLQNAHKWWSSYQREYMFHNLLVERGFTVMDVDYRGSAGYGRDVRTGIYRFMGGKDLDDHVDAADYLIAQQGINKDKIGMYGGSYGGFMTLMAMFTKPGKFAAGAALRSVTDWAHYNHGYTSNILNEPYTDSIAFYRSSPINFASGLQGTLLMCHGMVDTNVHFQDIVRLSQRLIELGKDNWELAVYPVEDHGFTTPSGWTDEYKRILKLFETTLLK